MKPGYIVLCIIGILCLLVLLELVIEIILMFCGVNVHKHFVPDMYETKLRRKTIREHFLVDEVGLEEKVRRGVGNMAGRRIVVCAIVRNIEEYFPECIEKIMIFTEGFKDYRIVLFENDSGDRTREYLKRWEGSDKRVKLLDCCEEGSCECKLKMVDLKSTYGNTYNRISKMAQLRNRCLEYVKKQYMDYDYMLVADADIGGGVYKEGYQTCFANDDWDAIFARGTRPFPFMFGRINAMYDGLSFRDKDGNGNFFILQGVYNRRVGSDMVPVRSAFNGAGIYRIKSIKGAKYDSKMGCEHIDFNSNFKRLYANPSFIINMGIDQDIKL